MPNTSDFPTKRSIEASEYQLAPLATVSSIVKKVVAVVGGGDTACEEATYLAGLASKVYLIVRKPFLRASKAMQDRVFANEKN